MFEAHQFQLSDGPQRLDTLRSPLPTSETAAIDAMLRGMLLHDSYALSVGDQGEGR